MELLYISYCREKESIERLYFLTGVELFSEYLILSLFYVVLHDFSDNRLKDTIILQISMSCLDRDTDFLLSFWIDILIFLLDEGSHSNEKGIS